MSGSASFKINGVTNTKWSSNKSPMTIGLSYMLGPYNSPNLLGDNSIIETTDCTSADCKLDTCRVCLATTMTQDSIAGQNPTTVKFTLTNGVEPADGANLKPTIIIGVDNLLGKTVLLKQADMTKVEVKNGQYSIIIPNSSIAVGRLLIFPSNSYKLTGFPDKIQDSSGKIVDISSFATKTFNSYNYPSNTGNFWGIPKVNDSDTSKWDNAGYFRVNNNTKEGALFDPNDVVFAKVGNETLYTNFDVGTSYNTAALFGGGIYGVANVYGYSTLYGATISPSTYIEYNIVNNKDVIKKNYNIGTSIHTSGTIKLGDSIEVDMTGISNIPNGKEIDVTIVYIYKSDSNILPWQYFGSNKNYIAFTSSSTGQGTLKFDNINTILPPGVNESHFTTCIPIIVSRVLVSYKFDGVNTTQQIFSRYIFNNTYSVYINLANSYQVGFNITDSTTNQGKWTFSKFKFSSDFSTGMPKKTLQTLKRSALTYSSACPCNILEVTNGTTVTPYNNVDWSNAYGVKVEIFQIGNTESHNIGS
jgi:hypothetical protein